MDEVKELAKANTGYIKTMWCGDLDCELKMKEEAGLSSRCMPFEQDVYKRQQLPLHSSGVILILFVRRQVKFPAKRRVVTLSLIHIFNSYDPYFKQPFGALRAGQTVRLTLCIPEAVSYTHLKTGPL